MPVERESEGSSAWEIAATGSAVRFDDEFAPGEGAGWTAAYGARLAWRPMRLAAIGIETWTAELDGRRVRAAGAHLRVVPLSRPAWLAEPALYFGVERVTADDDRDRSLAFVGGAGVARIGRRWTLDVAVRNHHLAVDTETVIAEDGEPFQTRRDATLWEVRASVAFVLGGDG